MIFLSDRNLWSNDESDEPLAMRNLTAAQNDQLGNLLEEYMTALESGMPPSVDSLTRMCPELREALQACVGGLETLHRMAVGESTAETLPTNNSRRLGDFELHEEIGRGGMGVVYRATQPSLRRTVAIKLLPLTSVLDSRQLTRFQHEAEAAASLQHPNIVPVYAVGCERGIHFYAMQFIKGTSLDVVIASKDVSTFARTWSPPSGDGSDLTGWRTAVAQAAQVADGLHAAHELGIIHRDIKPSNLIVDQSGKPWITDFGLARIQSNVSLTQSGDVIGTMRYMSPEQARGESAIVDGRTDIYSLGATLFEILAGKPAHDGDDAPAIMRQIDNDAVVPLRKHHPELPRDLETVVAKAMAARRDDRYETAKDFADDLRRILANEPTIARPPTIVDHSVRLATKYRATVATVVMVGILALAGFAISNTRLAVEKQLSDANATLARRNEVIAREAIDRLGSQMAELLGDIPAANSVRQRLLTETLDYYQRLANVSVSHTSLNREQQLDLAITHGKIGSFQRELGLASDALKSLDTSRKVLKRLADEWPDDDSLQIQWMISQNNLAEAYSTIGDFDTATRWFGEAIEVGKRLQSNANPRATIELATTLNNFGQMLTAAENVDEAETVFRRAIELLGQAENQTSLISTIQSNLAGLLARDNTSEAISLAQHALAGQLESLQANPSNAKMTTQVVLTLNTLASAQAAQSQHRNAIETLREAIDLSRQLRSRWPDQPAYRRDLGLSLNQLGLSLSAVGQTDRAADALGQAITQARALAKVYPDAAEVHSMLGSILNNAGFLDQRMGYRDAAARQYAEAIAHQEQAVTLAPQVPRYAAFLAKHQHNLMRLRRDS